MVLHRTFNFVAFRPIPLSLSLMKHLFQSGPAGEGLTKQEVIDIAWAVLESIREAGGGHVCIDQIGMDSGRDITFDGEKVSEGMDGS